MLVFDTETSAATDGDVTVQTLQLWCASLTLRHGRTLRPGVAQEYEGQTAEQFADVVDRLGRNKDTLWIFAHNLSFDLTTTRLPVLLLQRGWTLTQHALASDSPWCRLSRGRQHITIADSFSFLPVGVLELGKQVGIGKPELPGRDDIEAWQRRCRADVAIVSTAITTLMDWWDTNALGNWSLTGASTGWSAMRHRPMAVNVLIDPDDDARAFERAALMGGRREAWVWGKQPHALYSDIDIEHAHLTAAAHMALPYQRADTFESLPLDSFWLRSETLDVMADVEVETDVPRYPVLMPNGVFYPAGRFVTRLAGPEIREALGRGELLRVGRGVVYRVGAHMASWGRWLMAAMDARPPEVPPVVQPALKGWSRSVPGRWAAHTSEVIATYEDDRPGWHIEHGAWGVERWPVSYLTVGGRQYVLRRDLEGENSFPAVLCWIQSWCRVWLGRLVDALDGRAIQCNTDGVVINGRLSRRALDRLDSAIAPANVRVKQTAHDVTVLGAQHVILDAERRLSGVPHDADEVKDQHFRYWSWPGMLGQLTDGSPRGFLQRQITADLSHIPLNRWRLQNGRTAPVRAYLDGDGRNAIAPWPLLWANSEPLTTDPAQHPDLAAALARGAR